MFDLKTQNQKAQERKKAEEAEKEKQTIEQYNKNVLPKLLEKDRQKIQLHRDNSRKIDEYFYAEEIQ